MTQPQRKKVSTALKVYLITFNVLSALGWSYVLVLTVVHLLNLDGRADSKASTNVKTASSVVSRALTFSLQYFGKASRDSQLPTWLIPVYQRAKTTFLRVGTETALVQSLAIMEVVHVALGWVRSPLPTTAAQVASRLFLVWGIAERFPHVQGNALYGSMVFAWSVTEVIRYPFYALGLLGKSSTILLYLRYTTFYILYPLGASSEAFLIYASLPSSPPGTGWQSWVQGMWGPWDYVRAGLFGIWWPGLYVMYTYMMKQRRKVLGGGAAKAKLQ